MIKAKDVILDPAPCGRCAGTGIEYANKYEDGEIVGRAAFPCSDCKGTGQEMLEEP